MTEQAFARLMADANDELNVVVTELGKQFGVTDEVQAFTEHRVLIKRLGTDTLTQRRLLTNVIKAVLERARAESDPEVGATPPPSRRAPQKAA